MRALLVCLLSLLAVPALAQPHPCDVTAPPTVARKSPVTAGVCWNQKNSDGSPAGTATVLKVLIGGSTVKTITNPVPTGPANAAGLFYYQVPGVTQTTQGNKNLTFIIGTAEAGDSAQSLVYTFTIVVTGTPSAARIEE